MFRAKIWFRCAAMHDPVTPIVVQPCQISWEAKFRQVDLIIERPFNGDELLRRMKGWITIDPDEAIAVFNQFGKLRVLDNGEFLFETEKQKNLVNLQKEVEKYFGDQVDVEPIEETIR
jgi:hypothetical protein